MAKKLILLISAVVWLVACGSENTNTDLTPRGSSDSVRVRLLHGSYEGGLLDTFVGTEAVEENQSFGRISRRFNFRSDHVLQVIGREPGREDLTLFASLIPEQSQFDYLLVLFGPIGGTTVSGVFMLEDNREIPAGQAKLLALNAASGTSSIALYARPAGGGIDDYSDSLYGSVPEGSLSDFTFVSAGSTRLMVTHAGGREILDEVTFDVQDGAYYNVVVLDGPGGTVPFRLVVVPADNGEVIG